MSEHSKKREARTIHESGRAGDLPWKAVIEYDGDKTYTISQIEVHGESGDRPVNNLTHHTLEDALVEIRLTVTGALPRPLDSDR